MLRSWVLLSVCLTITARAEQSAVAVPPPVDCTARRWILQGAPTRLDRGGASFSPEWVPTLEGLASCLKTPEWKGVCLAIRGHTDKISFNDPVVNALGSVEAAQLMRGKGRSLSVLSRLYELGVPSERLRELPPAPEADYRGVDIAALDGCLRDDDAHAARVSDGQLRDLVRTQVHDGIAEEARIQAERLPPPAPQQHFFWLEGGLDAALVGFDPNAALGPVLRLGAGYRFRKVYARLGVGLSVASPVTQRLGGEGSIGVGYFHARWLQVGVVGSDRFSSSAVNMGWLEQTWALGLEGTHCLWDFHGLEVCGREAVLPLGGRLRRAVEEQGQLFRIPETTSTALRFELGLVVRRPF